MTRIRYRADIDGMRAVAVLGVMIYHGFPSVLPGGFIGVDIFFVISGYLISGILYKGHREGNFSFSEFYARRVRRLFPALITVLLLCMTYGWLVLLPDEYEQLGKHAASGTLFIQNIVFWKESGYFDTAASLKPLLHLWSLAVEEQFYIFFPPLLLLIWKRQWPLAAIMGVLLAASLIGNLVMSVQNVVTDFFLTPYRGWEFLGGTLLAWWHFDKGHEEEIPLHRNALSVGGAVLLALGMALIHRGDTYPGWRALLPVGGTLMLMEGGRGAWVNKRVLSQPAVVWVGLISYPLYLFHWPALSFLRIVKGENPKTGFIIAALVLSVLLSMLAYYFVEKKIRHNKSPWTVPLLVAAFLVTGAAGWMIWRDVLKASSTRSEFADAINASEEEATPQNALFISSSPHTTLYRMGGSGKKTLFVGDSNIEQYSPRINWVLQGHGRNSRGALMLWCGGVPPIPGITEKHRPGSEELIPEMEKQLDLDPSIDRVVIGAAWIIYCCNDSHHYQIHGNYFPSSKAQEDAVDSLRGLIANLRKSGKSVYVVLNLPMNPSLDPKSEIDRGFFGLHHKEIDPLKVAQFNSLYGDFIDRMAFSCRQAGACVIDPRPFFQMGGTFLRLINGIHVYKDGLHLRPSFVRDHLTYLDDTIKP